MINFVVRSSLIVLLRMMCRLAEDATPIIRNAVFVRVCAIAVSYSVLRFVTMYRIM